MSRPNLARALFRVLFVALFCALPVLMGCQMGYILKSATGQFRLLNQGESIERSLQDEKITPEQKEQIQRAVEAKNFAEEKLGLKKTKNYTQFVNLDRSSVSYVVSAAPKWELKHHLWYFPIIGNVPYKGYFNEEDAKAEQQELKAKDLDTYMRGVSAYSTLGWFKDPLLSSMLRQKPHDLVNTIIHETVHATLYIKSSADFNERLATFIGDQGSEIFYFEKEGPKSPTVAITKLENADQREFSKFISQEIKELKEWYKQNTDHSESTRQARLKEIQDRFVKTLKPKLKTDLYDKFPSIELNNARLLVYKTYVMDLSDFEVLFQKLDRNFHALIKISKSLEKVKNPDEELKRLAALSTEELKALATPEAP